MTAHTSTPGYAAISSLYSVVLLYIEPLTALAGFLAAHFFPSFYLAQTTPHLTTPTSDDAIPLAAHVTIRQLGNLYLLFAFNEAFVLRAASFMTTPGPGGKGSSRRSRVRHVNLGVWRTLLAGLLIADVGHLWSLRLLGSGLYWRVWEWNGMAWGNIGVVYAGMCVRVLFFLGVGIGELASEASGEDDGTEGSVGREKRKV